MKKLLFVSIVLSFAMDAFSQSKNPTNKKEIQDKIKQAQQQLNGLTPEQKKMMEQMGMSTNVPSVPTGITDADVKTAVDGGGAFGVPSRNAALIGAIPSITLTTAIVPAYIRSLNEYIEKSIAADAKFTAQNVYTYYKTNKYTAETTGNEAIGFWAIGQPEIAVYVMARACADNASDAGLLSNFAAMLSMGGAPHRAIPLLEYLSRQYPDNTTILNNLGQAWFYLGETAKASAQLDKVVKAFAYHPQANYTQCLIEQSKGNTTKAIDKMKNSLAYSYSLDKINMLRKLGYKVKGSDLRKPFRPDPNPLGLRNFTRPGYPKNYEEELQLKYVWDDFQKQLSATTDVINRQLQPYINNAAKQAAATYKKMGDKKGNVTVASVTKLPASAATASNLYRETAQRNLEDMDKDGGSEYRLKTAKKKIDSLMKSFMAQKDKTRKDLEKKFSVIADKETELAKKGENTGYDICKVQQAYSEWIYRNYNQPLEEAQTAYLHQLRLKIEEELYWEQFLQEDDEFIATQLNAKKEWLAALSARYLETVFTGNSNTCSAAEPDKNKTVKLAEFDDMHCAYKSTLDFKAYKQIVECGKMRIEFDAGRLSGNLNFAPDNTGKDRFVKATVEATVIDKDISIGKGPAQVGANVKAGMGMEISSRGIEDVYATGEAKVTAGAGPAEVNIVSASGRMSLISGNMTGAINGFGK
jgi:hypothetical protein